jgi:hypothetical protein
LQVGDGFIVVSDTANPGMRNLWVAVLTGVTLLSPATIHTLRGALVQYDAALLVQRTVWISLKFQQDRPAVTTCICESVEKHTGNKWRILRSDDAQAFKLARAKTNAKSQVMALVTDKEFEDGCLDCRYRS